MSAPDLRGLAERLDKATIRASGFCTRKPDCPYCEVRRLMNELLAALAVPEDGARSEWRLIETAPKDGSDVLIWSADGGHYVASWHWETTGYDYTVKPPRLIYSTERGRWHDGEWEHHPTHWMSLPAAPAAARPEAKEGESL